MTMCPRSYNIYEQDQNAEHLDRMIAVSQHLLFSNTRNPAAYQGILGKRVSVDARNKVEPQVGFRMSKLTDEGRGSLRRPSGVQPEELRKNKNKRNSI